MVLKTSNTPGSFKTLVPAVAALLLIACLPACGGAPPPTDQLVASQATIRAAEEVDANGHPKAALHLKLAKEQLEKAKSIMDTKGDQDRAKRLLLRAEADAELARALAKGKALQGEVETAMKELQRLKAAK
jgi:hypothetical protein